MTKPSGRGQAAPRFDTIDLLRGLAILAVVLLHVRIYLNGAGIQVGEGLSAWVRYALFKNGGNGVSAFFAMSGFLITYISIRRFGSLGKMAVGKFYRIRFARIAPPLLLFLFTLSILHLTNVSGFHIKPQVGTLSEALFAAITFQLNWFEAVHGWLPPCWTVLWSLSVEEMFYLFFPLLCFVFIRRRWGRTIYLIVLCGLVAFGPFARTPWYTKNDIWGYQSYLGNMDNVAMGCLTAMLTIRLSKNWRFVESLWPLVLEATGVLLMLFIVCWTWPKVILGWQVRHVLGETGTDVTILGLGTCLVMLGSVLRQASGGWLSAPLRWLGRCSYEVYLTHEFTVIWLLSLYLRWSHGPIALWICAIVVASSALGLLLVRLVSEPMNRLLRGAPVPFELVGKITASSTT